MSIDHGKIKRSDIRCQDIYMYKGSTRFGLYT